MIEREKILEYLSKQRARLQKTSVRRRVVLGTVLGVLGFLAAGFLLVVGAVTTDLPDVSKLEEYDPAQTTKVFAANGTLVATLFDENRTPVSSDQIAPIMKEALVSIEDRRFYEHDGVDLKGIARAALGNFVHGGVEQGASTLTMQLARRLFLSNERTYTRKLREAVLAYRIDHTLSKDKILELYLNEVYFGSGAYGIDAAAGTYFGTNPSELNLWQAALLAGLVQAPSAYSPLVDKEAALARTEEVLDAMVASGAISAESKQQALQQAREYKFVNHGVANGNGMLKYPYFTTYVMHQLADHFPENYIRRGGLQIYTTLDPKIQESAERALRNQINAQGKPLGVETGAVVVLDNKTGDIKAMVGGLDWDAKNQFNRAWQAKRQPGSSFKMFVYTAGIEAGFSPESELADTEAVFSYDTPNAWKPSNSDGKYMGPIPLRTGLEFSRNLVAAKLMAHLGPNKVISLAHRMGIEQELPAVTSLALGAGEITPLEMARAYSVLPNGGIKRPNLVITKVLNAEGEVLESYENERNQTERAIRSSTAEIMCEMMRRVVTAGTGTAANLPGTWVAGKTGTTDSFVDAWFVGFTPHHTISVWVGRDDNKPMGRVYGGTIPASVFRNVAQAAMTGLPASAPLPGVNFHEEETVELCWDSTYLALPGCPKTYRDSFYSGVVPTRECPLHRRHEETVSVVKMPDGTITNLAPTPTSETTPGDTPNDVNDPRLDPEVVTSRGALIPYREKEPEGEVEVLKIKIEEQYPKADEAEAPGDTQTEEEVTNEHFTPQSQP